MREVIIQKSKLEFETGDVLQFKSEQKTFNEGQIIVLKHIGLDAPAAFRVMGSNVKNSWASNEWLESLMHDGDLAYLGNIGFVD